MTLHGLQLVPSGDKWDKVPNLPEFVDWKEAQVSGLRVRTYMLPGQ